jgi:hypothetical protein
MTKRNPPNAETEPEKIARATLEPGKASGEQAEVATDRSGEDRVSGADPRLGREDNGNTPRIDEHGNKSWHPGIHRATR